MQNINATLTTLSGYIWGPVLLVLLFGLGIYLTIGLRAITWRWVGQAFKLLWRGRKSTATGEIPPFQSLMTALSSTVGTGNIAGVASAIAIGGPGAIVWMWLTALVGMATKYAECLLGVHYREVDANGQYVGGPMYYIKNGLGRRWQWLGVAFAFFGMTAAFGIGNIVQANEVTNAMLTTFDINRDSSATTRLMIGIIVAVLVAAVIIGGIRRIGHVAEKLVPIMALCYLGGACIILLANADAVPAALALIFSDAFTGTAAIGGFAGAGIRQAIQMGVARGIFSNESGLGSAPIAHAAAKTNQPVEQASIAMLGTLIDTLILCTATALVIITTNTWHSGENGAALSVTAFASGLSGGQYIVTLGLAVFALTTLIGWSYYGERCAAFLFGRHIIMPYRICWIIAIPFGAMHSQNTIWLIADILNGLMAFPNLIALSLLSPVVFKLTKTYQHSCKSRTLS